MPKFTNTHTIASYQSLTNRLHFLSRGAAPDILGELVLSMSDTCNLSCRYCFADKGRYGSPGQLMTYTVAKKAIDLFTTYFKGIGSIKFFGGEPLLNIKSIQQVCSHLRALADSGSFTLPQFNIVTNLTKAGNNIISFLVENNFGVTVSLDGPSNIHDRLRTFPNGVGSYYLVTRNINRLMKAMTSEYKIGIEAVYTPQHLEQNISMIDLKQFVSTDLGITNVVIHPLVENKWSAPFFSNLHKEIITEYYQQMRYMACEYGKHLVNEVAKGEKIGVVYSVLNTMASTELTDAYCGLGVNTLSVMANGAIYPCYMFAGEPDFVMGNVLDEEPFSHQFRAVQARFLGQKKSSNPHCDGCDIRNTCSSCQGSMFGKWGDTTYAVPLLCDYYIGFCEGVIEQLSHVATDPTKWALLVNSLREITSLTSQNQARLH